MRRARESGRTVKHCGKPPAGRPEGANGAGKDAPGSVVPFRRQGRGQEESGPAEEERTAAEPGGGAGMADRVGTLAAQGLSEEEIRELLAEALAAEPLDDDSMARALERGRLLGVARIKAAQYEAALQGKVSAQARVLARLNGEHPEEDGGAREFEVVRRIIRPEDP